MTTSRRQFLQTGTIAAVAAAVPIKAVASWLQQPDDPLQYYSKATFVSYVNSIFQIQAASGTVNTTLVSVSDLPAPAGGECFSLRFNGGSSQLKQDTYVVVHAALGTFQLFLVPAGADRRGTPEYLATINRLTYVAPSPTPTPTPKKKK
ncbi:MAG TPA: twin-arginine translocation signal domain-containing protein [Pyrinomonadaceae bacterium]|nr:twin-arginine translocation signal domain-containing protein [Pyrinomonadaceae bacterium]